MRFKQITHIKEYGVRLQRHCSLVFCAQRTSHSPHTLLCRHKTPLKFISSFASLTLAFGLACIFVALPALPGLASVTQNLPKAEAAITGSCDSTTGQDCSITGEIGKIGQKGQSGGSGGRGGDGGWAYVNCAAEAHSGSTNGLKGLDGQKVNGVAGGSGAYGGEYGHGGWPFANCGKGGKGGDGGDARQSGRVGEKGETYHGGAGGGGGGGGANGSAIPAEPAHGALSKNLNADVNIGTLNVISGNGNTGGDGGNGGKGGQGGNAGQFLETRDDDGGDDGFTRCNTANKWMQENSLFILLGGNSFYCLYPKLSDTDPRRTGYESDFQPNSVNWAHLLLLGLAEQCSGAQTSLVPCTKNNNTWGGRHNVNRAFAGGRVWGAGTGGGGGGGGGGNGGRGSDAGPGQSVNLTNYATNTANITTLNITSSFDGPNNGKSGDGNLTNPGYGGNGQNGGSSGGAFDNADKGNNGLPGADGGPGPPGNPSVAGTANVDLKGTVKLCTLNVQKKQSAIKVHIGKLTAKDNCQNLLIVSESINDFNDIVIDELVVNKPLQILNSGGKLRVGKLTFDLNSYTPLPYISNMSNIQIDVYNLLDMSVNLTYPMKYNAVSDNRVDTEDTQFITLSVPRQVDINTGKKVTLTDRDTGYVYEYALSGVETTLAVGQDFTFNIPLPSFQPANPATPPLPSDMPYLAYNTRYQVGVDQVFRITSNDPVYRRYSRASPNIGEFRTSKAPTGSIIVSPKSSPLNPSAVEVGINACQEFSAKVNVTPGLDKSVDWELYGAESINTKFTVQNPTNYVTNIATATLCVDNDESSQTLFVKANLHVDEAVYDFAVVAVLGAVPTTVTIVDPSSKSRTNIDPTASDAWQVQVRVTLRSGIVTSPYNAYKLINWQVLADVSDPGITIHNNGLCSHEDDSGSYLCPVTFNYVKPSIPPSSMVIKVSSVYDPSKSDAFQYILQSNAALPGNFSITPDNPTVDLSRLMIENYAELNFKAENGNPEATCTKLVWKVVGNSSENTKFQTNDGLDTSSTFGGEVTLQVAKNETSAAVTVKAICTGGATSGKFAVTAVNIKAPSASLQIKPKMVSLDLANYTSGLELCTSTPVTACVKMSGGDDDGNIDVTILQESIFKPGVETGVNWQVLGAKSPSTRFAKALTGENAGDTQESGHLIIGADETSSALFVVANLKADGGKVDYAAIKVSNQLQPDIGIKEDASANTRSQMSVDMSSGFTQPGVEAQCTLGASDGITYKKVPYSAVVQFPYGTKATDKIVRASLLGGGYNTYANQPPVPGSGSSISGFNHEFTGIVCISEFESAQTLLLQLELSSYQSATAYVTINLESKTSNSIRIDCLTSPDCNANLQYPATLTKDFIAQLSLPKTGADYFTEWEVLGGIEDTYIQKTSDDTANISTASLIVSPEETASELYITAKSRATGVADLFTVYLTNSKSLGVRIVGANNSAAPNQAMPNSQIRVFAKVNVGIFQSRNVIWSLLGNITNTEIMPNGSESTGNAAAMVKVGANENADTIWVVARLESSPEILDIIPINIFGERSNPQLRIDPNVNNVDLASVDYRVCAGNPGLPECNKEVEFTAEFNLPARHYCEEDTDSCRLENQNVNDVEWNLIGGVETTPIYNGVQIEHSRIISTGFDERNMPTVKVGVSPAETANIIWVVAKSRSFQGLIGIAKIVITGKWTTGVLIEPGNVCINIDASGQTGDGCFRNAENSIDFNALTAVPLGAVDTVSWELIGGATSLAYGDPNCGIVKVTCITPEGVLYISPSESNNFLYVRARLDYNPLLYDRVRVDIYGQHTQGVWMTPESWYADTDLDKAIEYDSVWNVCIDELSYDCVGTGSKDSPAPDSRCFKAQASGLPCRFSTDALEEVATLDEGLGGESGDDPTQESSHEIAMMVNANIIVPDGEMNRELAWEVYGATQTTRITPQTFLEENIPNSDGSYRRQAKLILNENETASIITVVARALYDPSRFDVLTIHVYGRNSAGIQITPRLVNVEVGQRLGFETKVDVPNGESSGVIFSLVGANDTTEITDEGVLVVSPFETSASLTVVASLVYDPNIFDYSTVIVTGRKSSGVLISPQKPVFDVGTSNTLHARVTMPPHLRRVNPDVQGNPTDASTRTSTLASARNLQANGVNTLNDKYPECVYDNVINGNAKTHCYNDDVSWKVLGGVSDTSIDPRTGVLKISPQEINPTLVVVAIADDDHSLKDAVIVEVSGRDGSAVRINQRGQSVSVGTALEMTAQVSVPAGHSKELVWSIFGNSSKASAIDTSGVLKLAADEKSTNIAVMAQLKEDLAQFDVSHIVPTNQLVKSIQISPHELSARRANLSANTNSPAEFTADVEIPANRDQGIVWTLSGNVSPNTSIVDGKLSVADDEMSSAISIQACLKDFPNICDHSIAYVDSINRLGYLKTSESYANEAIGQVKTSVFSTSVWPVYQKNSNHVISFSTLGDARNIESVSVDGVKIDSVQYSFGGSTDFAVNYERDESGNPVISALGSMFAVSIANADVLSPNAQTGDSGSASGDDNANSSTNDKVAHNVKGGVKNASKSTAKVVMFNPAFLETLASGEHTVEVKYMNGSEQKNFRVVSSDDVIKTSSFSVSYLILVIILFVFLSIYLVRTRIITPNNLKLDDLGRRNVSKSAASELHVEEEGIDVN